MIGYDKRDECLKVARAIAIDADAISVSTCTQDESSAIGNLASQLLAYSIGADQVRTGVVAFTKRELMLAIEQVIKDARTAALEAPINQVAV